MSRVIAEGPTDKRFAETFFLVEATDFERATLWDNAEGSVTWDQLAYGWIGTIGTLDEYPVVVSFIWAKIDGRLVVFWQPTSRVVDYVMIEKWLNENCKTPKWDNGQRPGKCDAANFHMCMAAIREAKGPSGGELAGAH